MMRDTVHAFIETEDKDAIMRSVYLIVARVQAYVPGYRLKQRVEFQAISPALASDIPGATDGLGGLKVSVFNEVEGATHCLPAYAVNLDIMTAPAQHAAERLVGRNLTSAA